MDACPMESTKRSRFCQIGSSGSKFRKFCHTAYTTGANAIAVPGWPELACCTASMLKVRIVLMLSLSSFAVPTGSLPHDSDYQRAKKFHSNYFMQFSRKILFRRLQRDLPQ